MDNTRQSYLYALVSVFFWSTVATAFKLALAELDIFQLIFIASGVSTLILSVILVVQEKIKLLFQLKKKDIFLLLLIGFFNPFFYYLVLFKAYSLLPAQIAQPLNMIWPITIAVLSIPLLKQKISWKHFIAMAISFIGVVFIASQGSIQGFKNSSFIGIFLALASSLIWATYWIINVKFKGDNIVKLFTSFFFGFIFLLITVPFFSDFKFQIGIPLYSAIYVGFFEVGITYVLWLLAMQKSKNNAAIGNLVFLAPFISLIFIHFILKESIYITTFIGLAFIVGGIFFQQTIKKIPDGR